MCYYKTNIRGEQGYTHEALNGSRIVCYQKHGKKQQYPLVWLTILVGIVELGLFIYLLNHYVVVRSLYG